jgi:hypothetical protein
MLYTIIQLYTYKKLCKKDYIHGRPEGGARGGICPHLQFNRMLNILTFILIYQHFIDIFTLVCAVWCC